MGELNLLGNIPGDKKLAVFFLTKHYNNKKKKNAHKIYKMSIENKAFMASIRR